MSDVTKEQAEAGVRIILAISETIRELGEVPSGVLYAQLCGILDIDQYTSIIDNLKRTGLVEERNHLLTWIGPKSEAKE
jgi:hypothetical protein